MAADKSDTPSPAYKRIGLSSAGRFAYGRISRDLSCPKLLKDTCQPGLFYFPSPEPLIPRAYTRSYRPVTHLSSWNLICHPPSSFIVLPGLGPTSLLTI